MSCCTHVDFLIQAFSFLLNSLILYEQIKICSDYSSELFPTKTCFSCESLSFYDLHKLVFALWKVLLLKNLHQILICKVMKLNLTYYDYSPLKYLN